MTPLAAAKKRRRFHLQTFLSTIDGGRTIATFTKKQTIFARGESADSVFYIERESVKLTALSASGNEGRLGILKERPFFGEGCRTGQPFRMCLASAMTDCTIMRIDKKSMMDVSHRERAFSDMLVAYLLARNIRYEEDLVDQLFNSSEKRLARVLLLLAHFGKEGKTEVAIPKISQERLAEMVRATRGKVNFFMKRLGKSGSIHYKGELESHRSLLSVVLHD